MKNLIILFVCLLPLLFIWGCTEASSPGYEDPTDPAVAPRVVWAWLDSPRPYRIWDGASAHTDSLPMGYYPGRLLIRFNKIMLSYTVIPNVTLIPKESGFAELYASAGFSSDGQTFEFPVYGMFKVARSYTIVVGKNATDVTDLKLEADYLKQIVPEPSFRLIDSDPRNNDTLVYPPQAIYLSFNSPIDSNTLKSNLTISPIVSGSWEQLGSHKYHYRFIPISRLKLYTWYQFYFTSGIKDTFNNHPVSPISIRFRTLPFKVNYTLPNNGDQNISTSTSIYCNFTDYIDTSTIREAFRIVPTINGSFDYAGYLQTNSLTFHPQVPLLQNTNYTVTIYTRLKSTSGDTLNSLYSFSFKTVPY